MEETGEKIFQLQGPRKTHRGGDSEQLEAEVTPSVIDIYKIMAGRGNHLSRDEKK